MSRLNPITLWNPAKTMLAAAALWVWAQAGATEITLTHPLTEASATRLARLVDRFNARQKGDKIILVRATARGKPAVLNLATADVLSDYLLKKSAYKPISRLMKETGEAASFKPLSADLLAGQNRERLTALPVAFGAPVLFFNKRVFRQAGLDPENPPRTWREMAEVSGKLLARGNACPYTTSWPVWVHLDNVSSIARVPVAGARNTLNFNNLVQVRHIAMLASWHKSGYFHTFGRTNEADEEFFKGKCAMLTSNSWAHSRLRDAPGVELGVASLPYHDDTGNTPPGHTLAAGASLWVGGGYKSADYKVAARFIRFVLSPEIQAELAQVGGFLPLTDAARQSLRASLQYDEEYVLDVAYASLQGKGAAQALRISALEPVRIVVDEELEQVWGGKKTAKAALDVAVRRGNAILSAKPALKQAVSF
ncbi:MAG: extracellular solute-binding protein [Zoogloeaceae bacterium]|jgi:sn-glycerol 3-phosphate transport system substrate-binding protein|nr:extracellular solute-binding protein [Zoogloeaceae bacterium]